MTQASVHPPGPPDSGGPPDGSSAATAVNGFSGVAAAHEPGTAIPTGQPARTGPVERVMSTVIRKLAWSRLADPKVAVTVAGLGLLLGMVVGATAPNKATLPIRLPLSVLPSLRPLQRPRAGHAATPATCWPASGWPGCCGRTARAGGPTPRHLLLVSAAIVAVMVSLTPVGSSDTASYAAYGRIAALGGNPYTTSPLRVPRSSLALLRASSAAVDRTSRRSTARSRPRCSGSPRRSAGRASSPPSGS